jgi:exodeoxyribonuclease V alpha subunit
LYNFGINNKKQNFLDQYQINASLTAEFLVLNELLYKESSSYGIYECIVQSEQNSSNDHTENECKIVGVFPVPLIPGRTYEITGKVSEYNNERQLYAQNITEITPRDKISIISYLKSLDQIGDVMANKLYSKYNQKIFEIIIKSPEKISLEMNIKKEKVLMWQKSIKKTENEYQTILKLLKYGLTLKQSKTIYNIYEERTPFLLLENPYFLIDAVSVFGFKKCDKIALQLGYEFDGESRISEAIKYILENNLNKGNCFIEREKLLLEAKELLKHKNKYVEDDLVFKQLDHLLASDVIISENNKLFSKKAYYAEEKIAEKIFEISSYFTAKFPDSEKILEEILKNKKIELEEKQKEACIEFTKASGGFHVLNGSAGCGKTFVLKIILEVLREQYRISRNSFNVLMLAPTGKAAKVVEMATGLNCQTIHRGLKYNPETGFEYNDFNQLEYDCIVIDEVSMLDIFLCENLLSAIKNGTKVIFVGDSKQLPSIGAGKVLEDIITSKLASVITLDVPKRQKVESGIINNAISITKKQMITTQKTTKDAYVINLKDTQDLMKTLKNIVNDTMRTLNCKINDIMILSPQREGSFGVSELNKFIQNEFNQTKSPIEIKLKEKKFKLGDKVIHINNNYQKEWHQKNKFGFYTPIVDLTGIMNGECGVITEIKEEEYFERKRQTIIVQYEDGCVFYEDDYTELEHAYALTIHKSQGSQWRAVIIIVLNENSYMLSNNLLYTAYTRAQDFCVVLGEKKAIEYAIVNDKTKDRNTYLREKLKEKFGKTENKLNN